MQISGLSLFISTLFSDILFGETEMSKYFAASERDVLITASLIVMSSTYPFVDLIDIVFEIVPFWSSILIST